MNTRYNHLVMITPDNNNKFYTMSYDGKSDKFEIERGRIEHTKVKEEPQPISKYDSILKAKLRKGYKDMTTLVGIEETPVSFKKEADNKVQNFVELMERYRNNLVSSTYSKASSVTKAQVEAAQAILDELVKSKNKSDTRKNELLIDLYSTIPRKMKKVQDFLIPNIKLEDILASEQDNLDAIGSTVDTASVKEKQDTTILTNIGIKMESVDPASVKELQYLLDQKTYYSSKPLRSLGIDVYKVVNEKEDKIYNKKKESLPVKESRFLLHGTRNSSVLSIFEQGLKIRPTGNFHFAGKVYGDGNYYSETVAKSLNYTGSDRDKVLLVYEVLIGKPFVYKGWYNGNSFTLNEAELLKRGFHSTFVEAGNGLLNSEIIVYNEQQQRLAYVIHINGGAN